MKVNLEGQTALVTGAARGIGQAIADAFSQNGARVFYADLDEESAQNAARAGGGEALRMNVAEENEVEAGIAEIVERCGRLDIVVNNAGINTLRNRAPIDEFAGDEWERVLRVDLTGLFLVSRAASRAMVAAQSGRIINIASVAGLVPLRLQSAFVAAKAGVVNLTKSMALELGGRGVLVNGIAPGSILTDATRTVFYGDDGEFKSSVQQLLDHIPLARPGTPDEVAQAALFLATPENTYINGHILVVDGGWSAGYLREF